jgi:hypothetical protein
VGWCGPEPGLSPGDYTARVFCPKGSALTAWGPQAPLSKAEVSRRLSSHNREVEMVPDAAGQGKLGRERAGVAFEAKRAQRALSSRGGYIPKGAVEPSEWLLQLSLHARKRRVQLGSKAIHDRDDRHRDAGSDQAVFDCGGGCFVRYETSEFSNHRHEYRSPVNSSTK